MFLTLKNGLEAGSFIFQIFLCGEGGQDGILKAFTIASFLLALNQCSIP